MGKKSFSPGARSGRSPGKGSQHSPTTSNKSKDLSPGSALRGAHRALSLSPLEDTPRSKEAKKKAKNRQRVQEYRARKKLEGLAARGAPARGGFKNPRSQQTFSSRKMPKTSTGRGVGSQSQSQSQPIVIGGDDDEEEARPRSRAPPFQASEYARLFMVIFDKEKAERLDRFVTGMTKQQVDDKTLAPQNKNVFLEFEEDFNDPDIVFENPLGDHGICGEDVVDPNTIPYSGVDARSWDKLETEFMKLKKLFTPIWAKYQRSGANDPEDRSDVWDYCGGNAWLLFVWLMAYELGDNTDLTMQLLTRIVGDENIEDGAEDGNFNSDGSDGDGDNDGKGPTNEAHAPRKRMGIRGSRPPSGGNADTELKNSVRDLCKSMTPATWETSQTPDTTQLQLELESKERIAESDMFARILTSNEAPQTTRDALNELIMMRVAKAKERLEKSA